MSHAIVRSSGSSRPMASPEQQAEAEPQGLRRLALALVLTAAFMVVLDFSIVNVALPSIQRELGFSVSAVQWIVTGYAITFGGLLILGGRAADLYGRRRTFIAGLLIFTAASLAGGLARDPALLVSSRLVQGVGAALVAPAALSLITTGYAEGPARNRALGMYGATASIGFVAGQVLGGVLVQFTSWRAVFLVNVPVGLLAVLVSPRLLGRSHRNRTGRRLDAGGALLITTAVAALVYAVSQVDVLGWTAPAVLAAAALAVAATATLCVVERRHPNPLIRTDLLRLPDLRKAATINLLLGLWNAGELIVLSLYFQQVLDYSPLATGLAIAPQGIVGFVAGAFGARLARRVGIRRVLILTGAVATAGFLILTRLPAGGGYSPLFAAVMLVGFGTAGTAFGTMVTASGGVANHEQGLVGGVINTSRQVGAAIGAALLPAIALAVNHGGHQAGADGDRAAMLAAAVAAATATGVAWHGRRPHGSGTGDVHVRAAAASEVPVPGTVIAGLVHRRPRFRSADRPRLPAAARAAATARAAAEAAKRTRTGGRRDRARTRRAGRRQGDAECHQHRSRNSHRRYHLSHLRTLLFSRSTEAVRTTMTERRTEVQTPKPFWQQAANRRRTPEGGASRGTPESLSPVIQQTPY
jgi:EmrB/QacA subfamily drug resistance transporter